MGGLRALPEPILIRGEQDGVSFLISAGKSVPIQDRLLPRRSEASKREERKECAKAAKTPWKSTVGFFATFAVRELRELHG